LTALVKGVPFRLQPQALGFPLGYEVVAYSCINKSPMPAPPPIDQARKPRSTKMRSTRLFEPATNGRATGRKIVERAKSPTCRLVKKTFLETLLCQA
nr:hypothetical protein [Tanacetum cinerariifolium]